MSGQSLFLRRPTQPSAPDQQRLPGKLSRMLKRELSLLPAEKPDQAPVNMLLLVLTAPLLLWPTQEQRSINPLPVAHSGLMLPL